MTRSGLSERVSRFRRSTLTSKPDFALAIVLVIFSFGDWLAGARLGSAPLAVAGLAAAEIPAIAVAWRTRLESRLLVIAVCCSAAAVLLHATDTGIPVLAALYTIAMRRSWQATAVAWAVASASFAFAAAINVGTHGNATLAVIDSIIAAVLAAVVVGAALWVAARRVRMQRVVERYAAIERERDLLRREQELLAREAIAVERARIARELHDVVAHHVSVMVIQAGAAEATLPEDAEQTRVTLEAVRESGREALAEMRRLLGVLREPANEAADATAEVEPEPREPQPGLSRIPVLVARMSEAGVSTTLQYAGRTRRLSGAVDVSAYRVVQEALTNTVRHAGRGATARVAIAYEPDCLTIEVTDDGRGSPEARSEARSEARPGERTDHSGHGLIGMRERVSLFGGTLETGPVRGAGFRVLARFPIDPMPGADDASSPTPAESGRDPQ